MKRNKGKERRFLQKKKGNDINECVSMILFINYLIYEKSYKNIVDFLFYMF